MEYIEFITKTPEDIKFLYILELIDRDTIIKYLQILTGEDFEWYQDNYNYIFGA